LFSQLSDLVLARSSAAKAFIHATIVLGDQRYTSATSPIEAHVLYIAFTLPLPFFPTKAPRCRTDHCYSVTSPMQIVELQRLCRGPTFGHSAISTIGSYGSALSSRRYQTLHPRQHARVRMHSGKSIADLLSWVTCALTVSRNCISSWYIRGSARGQLR
jgi:hypothetical protein